MVPLRGVTDDPFTCGHVTSRGTRFSSKVRVGQYRDRKIHQVDPQTGAILRTIESNRFVTGVTWVDGELWHGTWEGDESDLRRVDPRTGEVLERLEMPSGVGVSGSSPMAAIGSSAEEVGAGR
jgi:hypothetical protein